MLAGRFMEVWAFEPLVLNAVFCRINNPMSHVRVVEAAITDKIGSVKMKIAGAHYGKITEATDEVVIVPCTTIDTLGLSPGFIKLDLEGFDYQGLLGAQETIKKSRPVICVETKDYKHSKIQDFLTERGYTLRFDNQPDEVWTPC